VDVVAETYPREFYQYFRPAPAIGGKGSKRRQVDRLPWMPALLAWGESLAVEWDSAIRDRVVAGFSAGSNGEDEIGAVVGFMGMIAVATGALHSNLHPHSL
jgi:hypothetical protein